RRGDGRHFARHDGERPVAFHSLRAGPAADAHGCRRARPAGLHGGGRGGEGVCAESGGRRPGGGRGGRRQNVKGKGKKGGGCLSGRGEFVLHILRRGCIW